MRKALPKHRYEKIDEARSYLALCLKEGSLALALGAGASHGMGLPMWFQLVNACNKGIKVKKRYSKKSTNEELRLAINIVEDVILRNNKNNKQKAEIAFKKLVHKCLYKNGKIKSNQNIISNRLLVAIGAMISGSVRGSVKEVITLNFDDVLEWYLKIYGLRPQIAFNLPFIRKESDVTIYHLHGYLPYELPKGKLPPLIFSKRAYDRYLAQEQINLQQLVWKDLLTSKVILFIGLSGDDMTFGPIFEDVKNRLKINKSHSGPMGIWLFGEKKEKSKLDEIRDWGCVPLCLPNHDEYPSFIFSICQEAATLS